MQRPLIAASHDTHRAGIWVLMVRPPGGSPVNITTFRGSPMKIESYSFTDPYGPGQMSVTIPAVSPFEQKGVGDLSWAVKGADIDLIWKGDLPPNYPIGYRTPAGVVTPSFRWEGFLTTFSLNKSGGITLQCKGAMLQLDNWLAKPEYTARPLPYEWAMARQFRNRPALRLMPLKVVWPGWWSQTYNPVPKAPSWMIPAGVKRGDKWSGLLTRETGS